ncbi:MAG: flagellar FlbD family protein [Leptospiraceae bacterium]|nr:flagellar FlbD family protein [Leptospiraceae bacterium]MCP5498713.1 flagellar FlbD family protein [Leptospiraceae bacterium]
MILLHRLNKTEMYLNANHIESIESTPDTTLTLSNDKKLIVRESAQEVLDKIIEYQKKVFHLPSIINKEETEL